MERGSLPRDSASLDTAAPASLGRLTPASSPRCRQGRLRWSQPPEYRTHDFGCREKAGKADTTRSPVTLCGREKGSPAAVPAPTWAGDPPGRCLPPWQGLADGGVSGSPWSTQSTLLEGGEGGLLGARPDPLLSPCRGEEPVKNGLGFVVFLFFFLFRPGHVKPKPHTETKHFCGGPQKAMIPKGTGRETGGGGSSVPLSCRRRRTVLLGPCLAPLGWLRGSAGPVAPVSQDRAPGKGQIRTGTDVHSRSPLSAPASQRQDRA